MLTLEHLPAWQATYSYENNCGIIRTNNFRSATKQSNINGRRVRIADVTRVLRGAELPYFESFVRTHNKDGALKYIDTYVDHTGLQVGTVRIVEGTYNVQTDLRNHTITCSLEMFG